MPTMREMVIVGAALLSVLGRKAAHIRKPFPARIRAPYPERLRQPSYLRRLDDRLQELEAGTR
jgi:hypothetical protein